MRNQLLIFIAKSNIAIYKQGKRTMNDLTKLNETVDVLADEAVKSNKALAALATEVVAIRGDLARTDIQTQINAVQKKAQAILDGMTAAETAAEVALQPAVAEAPAVVVDAPVAEPVVTAPVVVPVADAPPVVVEAPVVAPVVSAPPVAVDVAVPGTDRTAEFFIGEEKVPA